MKIDNKLVHKVAAIKKKATNSLASEAQTIQNKFSKKIPFCGVLGGGYNKNFSKLVELHSILHQTCAKFI